MSMTSGGQAPQSGSETNEDGGKEIEIFPLTQFLRQLIQITKLVKYETIRVATHLVGAFSLVFPTELDSRSVHNQASAPSLNLMKQLLDLAAGMHYDLFKYAGVLQLFVVSNCVEGIVKKPFY